MFKPWPEFYRDLYVDLVRAHRTRRENYHRRLATLILFVIAAIPMNWYALSFLAYYVSTVTEYTAVGLILFMVAIPISCVMWIVCQLRDIYYLPAGMISMRDAYEDKMVALKLKQHIDKCRAGDENLTGLSGNYVAAGLLTRDQLHIIDELSNLNTDIGKLRDDLIKEQDLYPAHAALIRESILRLERKRQELNDNDLTLPWDGTKGWYELIKFPEDVPYNPQYPTCESIDHASITAKI